MPRENEAVWLALRMNVFRNVLSAIPVEIIGAFATEGEAAGACTTPYDVCGPVQLGIVYPADTVQWEGAYYPLANNAKSGARDAGR